MLLKTCPRCGEKISWIETQRKGKRIYYIAVHYYKGKKRKRCYLGPKQYEYVSRLHSDIGLEFEGAMSTERIINYLDKIIQTLEENPNLDRATLIRIATKIRKISRKIEELLAR